MFTVYDSGVMSNVVCWGKHFIAINVLPVLLKLFYAYFIGPFFDLNYKYLSWDSLVFSRCKFYTTRKYEENTDKIGIDRKL